MIKTDDGKFSFKKFGAVASFALFASDWFWLLLMTAGAVETHWTIRLTEAGVHYSIIIAMQSTMAGFASWALGIYTHAKIKGAQ